MAHPGAAARPPDRLLDPVLLGAMLVAFLAFVLSTLTWSGEVDLVVDAVVYNVVFGAAAVLCWRASRVALPDRWAWQLMAVALACHLAGSGYREFVLGGTADRSYPSVAGGLWLAFYPLAYAAMVALLHTRVIRTKTSLLLDGLDGLVGGLGAVALVGALVLHPVLAVTGGDFSATVTDLAYPIGDLMLLAVVVGAFVRIDAKAGKTWWLLAAAVGLFVVADVVFLLQTATKTHLGGGLIEVGYGLAGALMGAAAWRAGRAGSGGVVDVPVQANLDRGLAMPQAEQLGRRAGSMVMAQPFLFASASVGLLVYGQSTPIPVLASSAAAGCLVLTGVRVGLTFRELRSLGQARHEAATDHLTGLPNRRQLLRTLDEALADRAADQPLAFMLIDLDHFKEVNDALGHQVGDQLLRLVGPRMAGCLRAGDLLARLGGDEFAVVLPNVGRQGYAEAVARRLNEALRQPFELPNVALHVDASIGISLFPDHASDASGLLQGADVAMYEAKAVRGGHQVYRPADHGHSGQRLQTIEELHTALDGEEITVHYQPKINLQTGQVVGVEALVRWQHPTRGLVAPDAFLALAEHTGLMRPLTHRVLTVALDQQQIWRRAGVLLTVAVNLSTSNLLDRELPEWIAGQLTLRGLPAAVLELEITESTLMSDPERASQVLTELRALGIPVSIDDYGTGYSSLAYLQRLDVHELKIDRCFVQDMADQRTAEIVRSTIDLAHALGLSIVAEGVETDDAAHTLTSYGCDLAQGFQYSKALPPDQLTTWLDQYTPHAHTPREDAA